MGEGEVFIGKMVELSMASSGAVTYSELMEMSVGEIVAVAEAITRFLDRQNS
jgi:hypothetical protein